MRENNDNEGLSRALVWAVALHVVLILLFFIGLDWWRNDPPARNVVEAVFVDAPVKDRDAEKRAEELDKQRQKAIKEEQEEKRKAEVQRRLEEKKAAERKQAELKKKEAEEKRRQAEAAAAAKRKAQEEKKKEEAERNARFAREAEEKKQRELAERLKKQREAEQALERKLAAQRAAEAERERALQEAMAEEMAEELDREEAARRAAERAAQLAPQIAAYKDLLAKKVNSNWLKPAGASKEFQCRVLVKMIPGGQITSVELLTPCGDAVLDQSVLRAVRKSEPLPDYEEYGITDREIEFIFKPK